MLKFTTLLMAFLASTGPSATVSSELTEVFQHLEKGQKQTIVLYGTSLTIDGEWAKAMNSWFHETYPDQVIFVNSGQGGANSDFGFKNVEKRVLEHRPNLVVLEFSYNDAIDNLLTAEQAWNNLDKMVSCMREQNPKVAIVLQIMNVGWDPNPNQLPFSRRIDLEKFNENYRRYAQEQKLPLIDHYPNWLRLKEQENKTYRAYLPDGSHPTPEASLTVTWPSVKALLETARSSVHSKHVSNPK